MKNLLLIMLIFFSFNSIAQDQSNNSQIDSQLVKKFILSSRNDAAESGKFKNLDLNIFYSDSKKSYVLQLISNKEINSYLEVKDQDDNVIYFHEVNLTVGVNNIKLDTEEGDQTLFSFSFQDLKTAKPAIIVYRMQEEIVYSSK